MNRTKIIALIVALAVIVSILPSAILAASPTPPHRFYGTVTRSDTGQAVPDSILVVAVVDGVEKASCVTKDGWYGNVGPGGEKLDVFANPGDEVYFNVQGELMKGFTYWVSQEETVVGEFVPWQAGKVTRTRFVVDVGPAVEPPATPALLSPTDGSATNTMLTFEWAPVEDPTGVAYELQVDNDLDFSSPVIDLETLVNNYTPTSPLPDARYYWKVRVTNAAGLASDWTDIWSVYVDTLPPTVTIDVLPYHPVSPTLKPTFTGTATDTVTSIASVQYRVTAPGGGVEIDWRAASFTPDPADSKTGTFIFTTTALSEGWHILEVRAADAAGNRGSPTGYNPPAGFLVTTKPLVKFDDAEPMSAHPPMYVTDDFRTRDPSPIFKGEAISAAAKIAAVQCKIDSDAWTDAAFTPDPVDPKTGTWQFSPQPLSDGAHSIRVKAIDTVGGETPPGIYAEGWAGYITFAIDTLPPRMSNFRVTVITSNSAVITWTTDEPATSVVEYGEDTAYGSSAGEDTNLVTEHRIEIAGLGFMTQYHVKVKSRDAVGNEAVSADQLFRTTIPIWLYAAAGVAAIILLAIVLSVAWWLIRRIFR